MPPMINNGDNAQISIQSTITKKQDGYLSEFYETSMSYYSKQASHVEKESEEFEKPPKMPEEQEIDKFIQEKLGLEEGYFTKQTTTEMVVYL